MLTNKVFENIPPCSLLLEPTRLLFFVSFLPTHLFITLCLFFTFMQILCHLRIVFFISNGLFQQLLDKFGFSWQLLNYKDMKMDVNYLKTIKLISYWKSKLNPPWWFIKTCSIIEIQQFFLPACLLEPAWLSNFIKIRSCLFIRNTRVCRYFIPAV